MRKIFTTLLLTAITVVSVHAGTPVPVILVAGQSNTDGRVPVAQLPQYIKQHATDSTYTTGAIPFAYLAYNRTDGRFGPFWPQKGKFAYDAIVAYGLAQRWQRPFYMIKWSVGGTSISPLTNKHKGGHWSADEEWLSGNSSTANGGMSLLKSFFQEIDACIDSTLARCPEGYEIKAILWHQGESDYLNYEDYYHNLREMVQAMRAHVTAKTGVDYSALPFIMGSVSRRNSCYSPEIEVAMKRLAAEDPNVHLIITGDAELLPDRLHFTRKSTEKLGRQMLELLD